MEKITCNIYVRELEVRLDAHEILDILRQLYGLANDGDYWHATFLQHLKKDLGMKATASYLSLHFKPVQDKLHGTVATHVGEALGAGGKRFNEESLETARKSYTKPSDISYFTFTGLVMETHSDGTQCMNQKPYDKRLITVD